MPRQETALSRCPSPAQRERGSLPAADRGEGRARRRSSAIVRGAAREMRKQPARSEDILWSALRDRRLAGRKFRRQHPVGRFILDFYCHKERLAVEVDGPVHQLQRKADGERQAILENMGIRFLRLPAVLVEGNLPAALAVIQESLSPDPSPAQRERGDPQGLGEGL